MKELTSEQQAAVESTAPQILLTACAGSGKSTTLVERIVRTIGSGVHPNRIIAITYTIAAAHELDVKISRRMGWVEARHQRTSSLGYVGTLHGFCVRVLHRYGPRFGYLAKFGILTEQQTKELIEETAAEMRYKGSKVALMDAIESFLKERPAMLNKVQLVAAAFYGKLERNNLLTFDMVLVRGLKVLKLLREQPDADWPYEYLAVDELQDASDVDAAIYQAMPCSERFYVGDERQAIFGFRGGDVANFRRLAADPAVATMELTTNFRSDQSIVATANRLMNGSGSPMVANSRHEGFVGLVKYATGDREIVGVADIILKSIADRPQSSVAVLLRTNALVAEWTRGLENLGVKVHSRSVTLPGDWQMVLNYLALLNEPGNDWLAYSTLVAFRGRQVADELRAQALAKLTTINSCALNIPENIAVPTALDKLATVASVEAMTVLRDLVKQAPPEIEIHDLLLAAQRAVFPEKEAPGVTVTTLHSSKGLEFDCVFMPAFEQGILPLKVADSGEERRLSYVGVTRARHVLQLSWAVQRRNPFSKQLEATKPSSFLEHLGCQKL